MNFRLIISTFLIFAVLLPGCSRKFHLKRDREYPSSPWNFVRKNQQATASLKSGFKGQLNLKWGKKVSEGPIGPLTIAAGNLIFCGTKGRVNFYDLKTGHYNGRYKAKRAIQTGLTTIDSLAYFAVGPRRDEFICLNLHNQKKVWSRNLKDVTGAPIIIEDRLFVGSATGRIFCLNHFSGEILWNDSLKAKTLAGPSADSKTVFFPFDDGRIRGYDALKGDLIFETNLNQPLVSKVAVGSNVYVAGAEGGLFALNRENGETIWKKEFPYPIWTSPALDDGMLYFGDNGGSLRAINAAGGDVVWEFKSNGVILSSPIVMGDYVLFGSLDRDFYCLEKKTGRLASKREFNSGIRFPAVGDNGLICVTADDGTIQCFGN